jgi:hypothetical protein
MSTIKNLHNALSQIHSEKQALQAEVAALKAQLAELIPFSKFACDVLRDEDHPDNLAHGYDFLTFDGNEYVLKPNIEAAIDKILKD